jgi:hypothetical protein
VKVKGPSMTPGPCFAMSRRAKAMADFKAGVGSVTCA